MAEDKVMETMRSKAEAVQSVVAEVEDLRQAFRYAIHITRKQGGSTIAAPRLEKSDQAVLKELCRENGLTLLTSDLRDCMGSIHTGFTMPEWGIAETATLVQDSSSEDVRIATMLSEVHVAVLPRSHIRPDAASLEQELELSMKAAPRYLSFISGASRTADIERELTIGVHGPQELHILLVKGDP